MRLSSTIFYSCLLFVLSLTFSSDTFAGLIKECSEMNHPAHQDEYRDCLRLQILKKANDNEVDCLDCIFEQEDDSTAGIEVLTKDVLPALIQVTSSAALSKLQSDMSRKEAEKYALGYQSCTTQFNTILNSNTMNGANIITPSVAQELSMCNGYGLVGSFAGFSGYTSANGFNFSNPSLAAGYTSGFLTGYTGNFSGTGSIYDTGMLSGSMGISGTLSSDQTGISTAFGF